MVPDEASEAFGRFDVETSLSMGPSVVGIPRVVNGFAKERTEIPGRCTAWKQNQRRKIHKPRYPINSLAAFNAAGAIFSLLDSAADATAGLCCGPWVRLGGQLYSGL